MIIIVGLDFENQLPLEKILENSTIEKKIIRQIPDFSPQAIGASFQLVVDDNFTDTKLFEHENVSSVVVLSSEVSLQSPKVIFQDVLNEKNLKVIKNIFFSTQKNLTLQKAAEVRLKFLGTQLSEVLHFLEDEMEENRQNYLKHKKSRRINAKAMMIDAVYKIGQKPGSEYFDCIVSGDKLLAFVSSTNNYLLSAQLIEFYYGYRHQQKDLNQKSFSNHLSTWVQKSGAAAIRSDLSLLVMEINLQNLEYKISIEGDFYLKSTKRESLGTSGHLERGEQIVVLSPGGLKNLQLVGRERSYLNGLVEKTIGKTKFEILDQIMLEMKKDSSSMFMEYDSYGVYLEVSSNAIISV